MTNRIDILSRITLIGAFIVAALVSADEFQADNMFRAVSAAILGILGVIVLLKNRQVTIALLAFLAPWIDIVIMFVAFGIFGFRVTTGI